MARKKPFSGSKKKDQLLEKRLKKRTQVPNFKIETAETVKINFEPNVQPRSNYDQNRYKLHFERDSKEEILKRKEKAKEPLIHLTQKEKEMSVSDIYPDEHDLMIPIRPTWNYEMTKDQLLSSEEEYFKSYLHKMKNSGLSLSHFEHNLETWRQLWRVLEYSQLIIMIIDSRFPPLHFCLPLYLYINQQLKKPVMIIMNKLDLVPIENIIGWKRYFEEQYSNLLVVPFTSYPKDNLDLQDRNILSKSHLKRKKLKKNPIACMNILNACKQLCPNHDFSDWENQIKDISQSKINQDKVFTIGLVGYPNVGKSSVINALNGTKVVSVSRTPGHTKYFQTIYITENVCLYDCPGLIFPSVIEKPFQVLAGIYPISQVQEPFTAIGYLASRTNLAKILKILHPSKYENETNKQNLVYYECDDQDKWSAMDICTSWAIKRGFYTAKSGWPDIYRAALNILSLTVDGKISVYFLPKGFVDNKSDLINSDHYRDLDNQLKLLRIQDNN